MKRLNYLDNLRVFLTMLVVVHHTAVAYSGAGSWYYVDVGQRHGTVPGGAILTMFTAVNQAFFMSLFFFISAYFTPSSYDRKGPLRFLKDRFIRLGIPLLVFYFLIAPPMVWYLDARHVMTFPAAYLHYVLGFRQTFFGPTWFIETLIYFALVYTLIRLLTRTRQVNVGNQPFPTGKALLVTAIIFGLIAFVVRLKYPTGTGPLELQLGYFPLYILMMTMGVVAYRNHWLDQIPVRLTKRWKRIAILSMPAFAVLVSLSEILPGAGNATGGMNLQALIYAMWEPFVCFGISLALLLYFQKRWNFQNKLMHGLSNTAYTVYIIHPPFVVAWTLLFHPVAFPAFVKFLMVAPLSVATSFIVAYLICKIPYAKKVL